MMIISFQCSVAFNHYHFAFIHTVQYSVECVSTGTIANKQTLSRLLVQSVQYGMGLAVPYLTHADIIMSWYPHIQVQSMQYGALHIFLLLFSPWRRPTLPCTVYTRCGAFSTQRRRASSAFLVTSRQAATSHLLYCTRRQPQKKEDQPVSSPSPLVWYQKNKNKITPNSYFLLFFWLPKRIADHPGLQYDRHSKYKTQSRISVNRFFFLFQVLQ